MQTKTASQLVAEAKARISNLTVDQVADEIETGNAVLVDLREPGELAEQHGNRYLIRLTVRPGPVHRRGQGVES
jgi:hypothetical protein